MAGAPGIPQGFSVQTGNRTNLISWSLSTGATSYTIQRSLDNVTFTALITISGSPLATSYLDNAVIAGTQYWYKVCARNTDFIGNVSSGSNSITVSNTAGLVINTSITGLGIPDNTTITSVVSSTQFNISAVATATGFMLLSNSNSQFTSSQDIVPTATGEMSLGQIRLMSRQRADRVNSNFVTDSECNLYINQAMFELYDLLVTTYEDYFIGTPIQFSTDGNTFQFPLPDGATTYMNGINTNTTILAPPLYKLTGVDLALNNATNAYVTVNKFNFIDRNRFVYPNTASTIYGVFNMQYRMLGSNIEFIPTPTAGQQIRLWYIPRMNQLLQDTDITTQGISGWIEYVIVRTAIYILAKEESDISNLEQQLIFLKTRIEESASNRDAGQPDTISDTRSTRGGGFGSGGFGSGWNGGSAGW